MSTETMNKVLVVDDDPVNRMVLEELLDEGPYGVEMAESGEVALERCADFAPDVVLLDIMMPGIDGYETCTRLRRDAAQRLTKIMFVSAKASVSNKRQAYEAGGDDYIAKPFDHDELLARIALLTRWKSVEDAQCFPEDFLQWLRKELQSEALGCGVPLGDGPIATVDPEHVIARCQKYSGPLECLERLCAQGGAAGLAAGEVEIELSQPVADDALCRTVLARIGVAIEPVPGSATRFTLRSGR